MLTTGQMIDIIKNNETYKTTDKEIKLMVAIINGVLYYVDKNGKPNKIYGDAGRVLLTESILNLKWEKVISYVTYVEAFKALLDGECESISSYYSHIKQINQIMAYGTYSSIKQLLEDVELKELNFKWSIDK